MYSIILPSLRLGGGSAHEVGRYQKLTASIPWKSFGRQTVASRLAASLLPVGVLPFRPVPLPEREILAISSRDPQFEKFLMHIVGTSDTGRSREACDMRPCRRGYF